MALNTTQLERYYNAPIGKVYEAMKRYLESDQSRFTLKSADDLSCSCTFSSGISMTTWGENLTSSAVPNGEGTLVRLTVTGKIGSTAIGFQSSHNITIADEFFSGVSEILSENKTETLQKTESPLPETSAPPIPETNTPPDTSAKHQETPAAENPETSEAIVKTPEPPALEEESSSATSNATVLHGKSWARAKTLWNKHKLQIMIAAIVTISIIFLSTIVTIATRNNQAQERLKVIQKIAAACDKNNEIKILSTDEYSYKPALQFVWETTEEQDIAYCISDNTEMGDSTILKIGYSHSSKDNSSKEWKNWKATWTVDDDTEAATVTIQYLGDSAQSFKITTTIEYYDHSNEITNETSEEEHEPQPFTIGMNCYVVSDDTSLSPSTEHINGVTSQNFKNTVWATGKSVSCDSSDKDSTATGEKSTTDYEALKKAYGDDYNDTEYGLGALYSECASTSFAQLGMQTMSEPQAEELLGALVLCPDHPRAEEIKQKAEADLARWTEIQTKRQQGLIKDDGTYKVPSEMSTGTWRTMSEKITNCYWEMQDANGQIYDNNFVSAGIAQTITIPDGVAGFSSQGCGSWEKQ